LWKEDPSITIVDMAFRDEIARACEGIVCPSGKHA
jgi:hypothetical protein